MKKSFILYNDQEEIIDALTDEQAGRLIKAIFDYQKCDGQILDPLLSLIFIPFKQTFSRDAKKWNEIRKKRRVAGSLGGKKRVENQITSSKCYPQIEKNPSKSKQSQANQAVSVSVNVSDSVSVSDTEEELLLPKKSNKLNLSKSQVIAIQREFMGITTLEIKDQMEKCSNYMTISSTTYTNPGLFFKGWLKKFMGEKNKKELIEKQQRNVLDSLPEISEEQRIKNIERMDQIKSSLKLKEVF